MPAVVLLVDLQLGIESHQIGGNDAPENQLRPHWKTSLHSALAAPVTLASLPSSFTESFVSPYIRERWQERFAEGQDRLRTAHPLQAKPECAEMLVKRSKTPLH